MDRLGIVFATAMLAGCCSPRQPTETSQAKTSAANEVIATEPDVSALGSIVSGLTPKSIVCREPNPETAEALVRAFAVEAPPPALQGAAPGDQDPTASLGLRSQSMVLIQDAMFRACEAYANGTIDREAYAAILKRYADAIVILMISDSTGPLRPDPTMPPSP